MYSSILDGDYFMCLDDQFDVKKNNCLVTSFGINNEWSFDDAIDKKLGCKVNFIENPWTQIEYLNR